MLQIKIITPIRKNRMTIDSLRIEINRNSDLIYLKRLKTLPMLKHGCHSTKVQNSRMDSISVNYQHEHRFYTEDHQRYSTLNEEVEDESKLRKWVDKEQEEYQNVRNKITNKEILIKSRAPKLKKQFICLPKPQAVLISNHLETITQTQKNVKRFKKDIASRKDKSHVNYLGELKIFEQDQEDQISKTLSIDAFIKKSISNDKCVKMLEKPLNFPRIQSKNPSRLQSRCIELKSIQTKNSSLFSETKKITPWTNQNDNFQFY